MQKELIVLLMNSGQPERTSLTYRLFGAVTYSNSVKSIETGIIPSVFIVAKSQRLNNKECVNGARSGKLVSCVQLCLSPISKYSFSNCFRKKIKMGTNGERINFAFKKA